MRRDGRWTSEGTIPREEGPKESKLVNFFRGSLKRSTSSGKVPNRTFSSNHGDRKVNGKSTGSRPRSLSRERKPLRRTKSRDFSSHSQHRHKSPSKARLEEFMKDMEARERRGVSRFKSLQQQSNGERSRHLIRSKSAMVETKMATHMDEASERRRTKSQERSQRSRSREKGSPRRSMKKVQARNSRSPVSTRKKGEEVSKVESLSFGGSANGIAALSDDEPETNDLWDIEPSSSNSYHARPTVNTPPVRQKSSGSLRVGRSLSYTKKATQRRGRRGQHTAIPPPPPPTWDESVLQWHDSILQRDWISIEILLQSYDHKTHQSKHSPGKSSKSSRRLRVIKYLTTSEATDEKIDANLPAPLLQVDSDGRTPLHLACKEHMPPKLLQKLLLMDRRAASALDNESRLPLHWAVIGNHNRNIIDRLIRAHPEGLSRADKLSCTPLAYAVLRADHLRDKSLSNTWRYPTTDQQTEWQARQEEIWENAKFLLETMLTRRKFLSRTSEKSLLLDSIQTLAPPSTMKIMLPASAGLLQNNEKMAVQMLRLLIRCNYPVPTLQKALEVSTKNGISNLSIHPTLRQGLSDHFEAGYPGIFRESTRRELSFHSEIMQNKMKSLTVSSNSGFHVFHSLSPECQEWWDKLRFFIGCRCYGAQDAIHMVDDINVLHAALMIPDCPSALIELLVRIAPSSRYDVDPITGTLPIHLACKYWSLNHHGRSNGTTAKSSQVSVLKLLLAGDSSLAWKRYNRRLPLHYAILAGKSFSSLQVLLSLDNKTANVRDPHTRLFPFQLAALDISVPKFPLYDNDGDNGEGDGNVTSASKCNNVEETKRQQLENIYELLRMNPIAVLPKMGCGSGDPKGDIGPVTQHVLNWCYRYDRRREEMKKMKPNDGWEINQRNVQIIRNVITSRGDVSINEEFRQWWEQLKRLIWDIYETSISTDDRRVVQSFQLLLLPTLPLHDDNYLLHAALSIGPMPPIVIALILELYPMSIRIPVPATGGGGTGRRRGRGMTNNCYPIHIAAGVSSYKPLPFETKAKILPISMDSTIEMLSLAYPDACTIKSTNGRLPLHIAIESGKTYDEIQFLLIDNNNDRKNNGKKKKKANIKSNKNQQQQQQHSSLYSLSIRDRLYGLFPFQQMACKESYIPIHELIKVSTCTIRWNNQSAETNSRTLSNIQYQYKLQKLESIYILLRLRPNVLKYCNYNNNHTNTTNTFMTTASMTLQNFWKRHRNDDYDDDFDDDDDDDDDYDDDDVSSYKNNNIIIKNKKNKKRNDSNPFELQGFDFMFDRACC